VQTPQVFPFALLAARPRRAAANAPTMPAADRQSEPSAMRLPLSRVQNAFATVAELTTSRAARPAKRRAGVGVRSGSPPGHAGPGRMLRACRAQFASASLRARVAAAPRVSNAFAICAELTPHARLNV